MGEIYDMWITSQFEKTLKGNDLDYKSSFNVEKAFNKITHCLKGSGDMEAVRYGYSRVL